MNKFAFNNLFWDTLNDTSRIIRVYRMPCFRICCRQDEALLLLPHFAQPILLYSEVCTKFHVCSLNMLKLKWIRHYNFLDEQVIFSKSISHDYSIYIKCSYDVETKQLFSCTKKSSGFFIVVTLFLGRFRSKRIFVKTS